MSNNIYKFLISYTQLIGQIGNQPYNARLLQSLVSNFELNLLQIQRSIPVKQRIRFWIQLFCTRTTVQLKGAVQPAQVAIWPVQYIHLDFLVPVYRALQSLQTTAVFISIRPEMEALVEQEHAPHIAIQQRIHYGLFVSSLKRGWNILKLLYTVRKQFPNDSVMRKAIFRTVLNFQYYETYCATYPLVKQQINPQYHLWGYEFSVACRPLNILANADKLPSGNIQHGAINSNLLPLSLCSQQFVWDKLTAGLVQQACPTAQVMVTGSPGSKHIQPEPIVHSELTAFIKHHQHTVLVCFSGPGHNVTEAGHVQNLVALQTQIEAYPQTAFIIKLHNKDQRKYYQSMLGCKNVYMIDQQHNLFGQSIFNLIDIADCIVTGASTVAVEALLAGKAVISMDLKKELGHIAFLQTPMIVKCHTTAQVNKAFNELQYPTPTYTQRLLEIKAYSQQHQHLHTAVAATQIAQHIKQQLSVCAA